jgi:hypothetical protein
MNYAIRSYYFFLHIRELSSLTRSARYRIDTKHVPHPPYFYHHYQKQARPCASPL